MTDSQNEFDPIPSPDSGRWHYLSIPMILAIGWIIYEVSHSPGTAAMVMCLKFGVEDFRTAFWLYRRDPWEARGRATRLLYMASGMWKAAMAGILMVIVIIIVSTFVKIGAAGNGLPLKLNGNHKAAEDIRVMLGAAFGATLIGQAIASLACARAMSIARKYRISLWLSGTLHYARHRDDWPPVYGHANRLFWLNGCCFLFNWLIFIPIFSLFFGKLFNELFSLHVPRGFFLFAFFFAYLRRAIALGNIHQTLGTFAAHPEQCWKVGVGEEPVAS